MSLRLICGRSGSGKTEFCLNETTEKLDENKIYIITPEQFSYSMEKKLIEKTTSGAILNAEVLTFKRMAYRVENEVGGVVDKKLSKTAKAMIIYSILLENKNSLKFLGKNEQNIDIIENSLTEFKKHNISLEDLKNVRETCEDRFLQEKLKDLEYLYEKFEEKISKKYIDENDVLTNLAYNLDNTDMFKDCIFYIDEFTGFTSQEYKIIEKILMKAKKITVTITTDDLDMGTNQDTDIFYSNKQTADKLLYIARNNNIKCEKTVFLNEIHRFKTKELQHIEQNLYKIPYSIYNKDVNNIKLFLASNTYNEIENVAKEITNLIKNEKYRYREISVITKNLENYSSLVKAIFNSYNIPVFIDEKKNLSQNILIKYVMSLLDIYTKNWSYDSVMNYIKTNFVNIDNDDIFILENYCKKWGIKGSKWYKGQWDFKDETEDNKEQIERIKELKNKIITPIANLKDDISNNKTVDVISSKIYSFLLENKIDEILLNKKDDFEQNGYIEIANQQEQAWNIIIDILDELKEIFGEEKISFDKYMKLLKIGLNASGLGLIPQTQDQVIVGDIERSRTHKVRSIFIIGLNDGVFPTIHKDEGFLGDNDRKILKQKGVELAKGTIDALYEDNFSIYKAFTTAEEKLFLSYSSSNSDGGALRPSILVNKVKKIFPKLKEYSDISNQENELLISNLTFDELIFNLGKFKDGEEIDKKWFEIYNYFSKNEEWKDKLQLALKAFFYTNKPEKISKENVDKLYGNTLNTTVSRLEKYKSCPFLYYLTYGLKLKENEVMEIKPLDTGNFMHDVIDTFFKISRQRSLKVKDLEEEQIEELVNEIVDEKLYLNKNYKFVSSEKYQVLARRLKRVILKSMKYIVEGLKQSEFEIYGTELEFKKGKEYEPITIDLEDGKKVEITGKIDRIDIAKNQDGKYIRIIDYKSSVKNIDLNEVVYGLQLQLLTYLDATCKEEEVMPAGVLYFNLVDPMIKAKNRLTDEEIEQEIKKEFKMKGLILADVNIIKMMDRTLESGTSSIIPAQINSDGSIGRKSSVVTKSQFEDLQKYISKIIKQISKEILSGKIDIEPCYNIKYKKTPCEYCNYKSICQFDTAENKNNYNYIGKKEKQEILDEIKERN